MMGRIRCGCGWGEGLPCVMGRGRCGWCEGLPCDMGRGRCGCGWCEGLPLIWGGVVVDVDGVKVYLV